MARKETTPEEETYLREHAASEARTVELSDREVAGAVRGLMRYDLDHECVCVRGRDRIALLSTLLADSELERRRLEGELGRVTRGILRILDGDVGQAAGGPSSCCRPRVPSAYEEGTGQ